MNKGIEHAQGEYIYLLNSGDILSNPTVLSSISFDGTKYICGNMRIIHSETVSYTHLTLPTNSRV